MKPSTVIAIATILALSTFARADEARPTVTIDTGVLSGTSDGTVDVFKGIPYASPPTGVLRWQPPAPATHWEGTRDASDFGAVCPQAPRPDRVIAMGADQRQSEDCLFLNVWSFRGARDAPVMVWIHGGAFRFGSGSGRFYYGDDFARDGVILVSLNYRLGALGFFAHPALTKAAAPDAPLGNYGIMDQIAALKWVQRNIAAFGGDPSNVTVFGESAGGESVLTLMTLPAAQDLFARAIVESGGGWYGTRTLADAEKAGEALAEAAGLPADATPAQLRSLGPDKLSAEPTTIASVGPIEDGRLIRENPTLAFAEGREMHIPLMIGSNSYEASLAKAFKIAPEAIVSRIGPEVRPLYTGNTESIADQMFTDTVMGAPAHWIAEEASSDAPIYLYHFSYVPTRRQGSVPGAGHGSEIPFVFGDWPDLFKRLASLEDLAMENLVHGCWVAFAKTGKPSCGEIAWPAFTSQNDVLMEFGNGATLQKDFRKAQYDALDRALRPGHGG